MRSSMRALLAGALVLVTLAVTAAGASAVTVNPPGAIDAQGASLQQFTIPSIGRSYLCIWRLQGQILQNQIPLIDGLAQIGRIGAATILCNNPGVIVQPLVSPPGMAPGPWPIGLTPTRGVLGLPQPTGVLVELLVVRIRIIDNSIGFRCLFTGRLGFLVRNGVNPQALLLGGQFSATPNVLEGDNCPAGLPMTKQQGLYNMFPQWVIGP